MNHAITIRRSTEADRAAIEQLAGLETRRPPEGEALLALVDGELRAALLEDGGQALADPFHLTADVVELLRVRAGQNVRESRPRRLLARWVASARAHGRHARSAGDDPGLGVRSRLSRLLLAPGGER